jgi:hypothetical protein
MNRFDLADSDLEQESPTSFDESASPMLHLRPIVVRDGSIETMAFFQQKSSSTARVWFPESISVVSTWIFQNDNEFQLISFESNSL